MSIVTSRMAKANNPLVEGYDVTKPTSYVSYFDAVNLYGATRMKQLPVDNIQFLSGEEIASFDIMKVDPNRSIYICHSWNQKFYIKQGLVLTEIHKVRSFKQSAWLAPYINFNTELRKMAMNSFTKDFYKLMSNADCTYLLICYFMVNV